MVLRGAQPLPQTAAIALATPSEPAGHQRIKWVLKRTRRWPPAGLGLGFRLGDVRPCVMQMPDIY